MCNIIRNINDKTGNKGFYMLPMVNSYSVENFSYTANVSVGLPIIYSAIIAMKNILWKHDF